MLVGERTNLIGSRVFKRLVRDGRFEEASEIARRQVRGGAQVIDVCLADPDGDEPAAMDAFLDRAVRKVKVPFMIDSTSAEVFERALTWMQGKAILNSINLEDGEERFARVVPLARAYGAALVVGCIDEDPAQGMAVTRARKLAVAERSYDLLVNKYGVAPEDIIFDPLVFPCATGDAAYLGSAPRDDRGGAPDQAGAARLPDHPGHQQRQLRPAAGGARGPQLGLPPPRDEGRARPRDRQHREARALRLAARRGTPARASGSCSRPTTAAVAAITEFYRARAGDAAGASRAARGGAAACRRTRPMAAPTRSTSASRATSSRGRATGSWPTST